MVIEVNGVFTERFLNICTRRGICIWNVKKKSKTKITACISIRGFKMLVPIARKSRCTVHIVKRCGIPFILHRYRKRKAFIIGLLICLIMLYTMTAFVWVIDISGNKEVPDEEISLCLKECGLSVGMRKNTLDTDSIKRNIMMKMPEIAFISVNIKGTTVEVDVRERVKLPEPFDKDTPCNIIAVQDGVITDYTLKSGVPIVKVNDVVHKGQILVTGTVDSKNEGIRFLHSEGEVMARVWHEEFADLPMFQEKKVRTGNNKSKHMLKIFNFYVKLYKGDVNFSDFENESYVKSLKLGNNNVLPFSFCYDKYYEVKTEQIQLNNDEATEKFKAELDKKYKDCEIVNREFSIEGDKIKATYECIENIGQQTEVLYENNGQ